MDHFVPKLNDLIGRETEAYGKLLELSQKQTDAIIKNSLSETEAAVSQEREVLKTVKALEAERKELFGLISAQTGIQKPGISDIAGGVSPELREDLMKRWAALEDTAASLRSVNERNKTLIAAQMKYNTFFLSLVTGAPDALDTYSSAGKVNDKHPAKYSLLDQTI